jgi:filamentous hemagglutinin family protein
MIKKIKRLRLPSPASLLRVTISLALLVPGPAWANPHGGSVVSGAANILRSNHGNTLTINQLSPYAILDWKSFSIGAGQLTQFLQPSSASAVLNRVTGGNLSSIYGTLSGNGNIYLINPNGLVIGRSGVINSQSFIASTLDVSNAAFLAGGSLLFSGTSGAGISNAGQIDALGGDVALIAATVQNTGSINASQGDAALAAGSQVLLSPAGDQHVFVQAGSGSSAVGVDQKGQIQAATAELAAAGGNVYGVAINNSGVVRATAEQDQGGRVFLTAAGGTVDNSGTLAAQNGGQGGAVQVVGGQINLQNGSRIDVSGADGGGTALIGGGSHGADPDVPDAGYTTVAAGATIDADAVQSGNGGKVVVWSDDGTDFEGAITARGGALSGNGGNVEVSGGVLGFNGTVDLRAPNGTVGGLLLDPTDLEITSGSNSDTSCTSGTCSPTSSLGSGVASILNVNTLETALGESAVTVTTVGSPATTGDNGDITVAAPISWSSGYSLTLDAARNIVVTSAITATGAGALDLQASSGQIQLNVAGTSSSPSIGTAGGGQQYNGPVVLGANTYLKDTNGGQIYFGETVDGAHSLTTASDGGTEFSGAVGGSTALTSLTTEGDGATDINGGGVTTSQGQTYNAVSLGADTTLTSTGSGASADITFGSTIDGAHALTVESNGVTSFDGDIGDTAALASLTVKGDSSSSNGSMSMGSVAYGITTTGAQTYDNAVTLNGGPGFTSTNAGNITFASTLDGSYNVTVQTDGIAAFNGAVGSNGPLSGLATIGNSSNQAGSTLIGAGISTNGGGQTYYNAVTLTGDATLMDAAGGGINFYSTLDGAHNLTLRTDAIVQFSGVVGGQAPLASLTSEGYSSPGGGQTWILGGDVATTGAQIYNNAVMVTGNNGNPPTLVSTQGGNITFASTLDDWFGSDAVTIQTDGATTFGGAVGSNYSLGSLTSEGYTAATVGTTNINGGFVATSGGQTYGNAVSLGADTALYGAGVNLAATVDGNHALTINDSGATTLGGVIGGSASLNSLNVTSAFGTTLDNNVTTSGAQTYNSALALGGGATLTGNGIDFVSTVNGSHALTISDSGATTLGGAIGGTTSLTSLNVTSTGGTTLDGSVKTSGAQTYHSALALGGGIALTGNDIDFVSTVNGGHALTISDAGTTTLGGAIGGTASLTSLNVTSTDGTTLDNNVTTSGAQTYNSAATLGGNVVLTSNGGNVSIGGVTGASHNLEFNAPDGNVTWNGALNVGNFQAFGENVYMNGGVTTNGTTGSTIVAGQAFQNAGAYTIDPLSTGVFLIYSAEPSSDVFGGLTGTRQYGTTYPQGANFSGSGLLFTSAAPPTPPTPATPLPPVSQTTWVNYQSIPVSQSFDVPSPDVQTHGGGFFSIIESPILDYRRRAMRSNRHGFDYDRHQKSASPHSTMLDLKTDYANL